MQLETHFANEVSSYFQNGKLQTCGWDVITFVFRLSQLMPSHEVWGAAGLCGVLLALVLLAVNSKVLW